MKKSLTILLLLVLVCAGCVYVGSVTKQVSIQDENVHDAEDIINCSSHVHPDGTKCYALGCLP